MSTRLRKKLPIARPLDKGNPSYGNEINRRRPDSTCVQTSLSFFHCACVQTSLFYPLGMCFRSRAFRRLFFFHCASVQTSHFFPLHMRSDVSLFISAVHPFSRLLVMKSREKRPGMLLRRWCVTASLKALPKISDQNMWSSLSFNSDNWLKKKEHTWFQSLVTGSTKPSPSIGPKRLKSSQTFRTNMFIIVGHHTEFGFNGFIRKAGSSLESFPSSEKHM